ncbi:MAG: hypothetical protein QXV26_06980 [Candidatus Methanomethylicia archaeon]
MPNRNCARPINIDILVNTVYPYADPKPTIIEYLANLFTGFQ